MELMSAKINKMMRTQKFESFDDANAFLMENAAGLKLQSIEFEPENLLEEAQLVMWQAFEEPSKRKRIAMAEKALEICADCADAYVLLAEDRARRVEEEIELYRKGVEAGRRALGEALTDAVTPFWSDLKTRPYMRSLDGLAYALKRSGKTDEAIENWNELLKLNPDDNQGVRMALVPALLDAERLDEAESLLNRYSDGSASMTYSRALLMFKKHGNSEIANSAFMRSINQNRHVFEILIGATKLSYPDGDSAAVGSIEEATEYLHDAMSTWIDTEGALDWIADVLRSLIKKVQLKQTFPGIEADIAPSNVVPFNLPTRP
jgi:tetratricopeptide (TPR) repeat protein